MSGVLGGLIGSTVVASTELELITTTTVSGSSVLEITLSNLSAQASKFKHLQLRYIMRTGATGTALTAMLRFNGVTGVYARHGLLGDGASVGVSFPGANQTNGTFGLVGGASVANLFGVGVIDILDAFSTSKTKVIRTMSGVPATTNGNVGLQSTMTTSTSAIDSITIIAPTAGEMVAVPGSRVSLYGIRG